MSTKRIKDQAQVVGEELNQLGRVTRDEAQDRLHGLKDTAHDLIDRGMSKAEQLEQRADSMIGTRPFRAAAIAAVAGVAIGILVGRGTRH